MGGQKQHLRKVSSRLTAAANPPLYERGVEMEDRHMRSLHQEDISQPSPAEDDRAITSRALA
jgi:hypothetical protein